MHPLIELCAKVCEERSEISHKHAGNTRAAKLKKQYLAKSNGAKECAAAIRALPQSEINKAAGSLVLPPEAIELLSGGGIDNLSMFDRQQAEAKAYRIYERLLQLIAAPAALPEEEKALRLIRTVQDAAMKACDDACTGPECAAAYQRCSAAIDNLNQAALLTAAQGERK